MNPLDILRYGQEHIEDEIRTFGPADWEATALGTWSAKDLVGHIGVYEVRFAEILMTFAGEEPATNLRGEPTATFNDDQAAIRSGWSVDAVVDELRAAHRRVIDLAERIAPETWRTVGTIPWYGSEYSLEDLLVYTQYGHKREHAPQLGAVRERSVG